MNDISDYRGEDLRGRRFGEWIVLEFIQAKGPHVTWLCRCSCGRELPVNGSNLKYGGSKSCGHGIKKPAVFRSPERTIWQGMKWRCRCSPNYAGRGIKVCQRWQKSFLDFYSDVGQRPTKKHQIDRIDNDGHYSCGKCEECIANGWPANCRWATQKEQLRNTRRTRRIVSRVQEQPLIELSDSLGVPYSSVWNRLNAGWTAEQIKEWATGTNSKIMSLAGKGLKSSSIREIRECFDGILVLCRERIAGSAPPPLGNPESDLHPGSASL